MLDFEIARQQLLDIHHCSLKTVKLALLEAANRFLAEPLYARYPSPMFDNSAMDGYAICDQTGKLTSFKVIDRIQAGEAATAPLQYGETVRIFTGAPLPKNATAVVAQEQTSIEGNLLTVTADVKPSQHMRLQAEEIKEGNCLLEEGSQLSAAGLGLAASQGYEHILIYDKLKVIVFSSGNEIIEPGQTLSASKIYDANRYQLISWLKTLGVEVAYGGILPDHLERTETALSYAAQKFDVIITSGGASVGDADYLKQAIHKVGMLSMHSLAIKPGKPFGWGYIGKSKVFILPGNPVATFVTAHMLLFPVLNKLMGKAARYWSLPAVMAKAGFETNKGISRREFLRVRITINEKGETEALLLPNQGSAMLKTCVEANALCEVPANVQVEKGMQLKVYLLPV